VEDELRGVLVEEEEAVMSSPDAWTGFDLAVVRVDA
jgi:hypothetical protein